MEREAQRKSLRPILLWQEAVTEWRGISLLPGFINLGHMVHTNKKLQHRQKQKLGVFMNHFPSCSDYCKHFILKWNIKDKINRLIRKEVNSWQRWDDVVVMKWAFGYDCPLIWNFLQKTWNIGKSKLAIN